MCWIAGTQRPTVHMPRCFTSSVVVGGGCDGVERCRVRRTSRPMILPTRASRAISVRHQSTTTALPPQQEPSSFYSAEQKQVMDQCKQLHSSIMDLNERVSVWAPTVLKRSFLGLINASISLLVLFQSKPYFCPVASRTSGPTFGSGDRPPLCPFGRQPFLGKVVVHQLCFRATGPDGGGRPHG